MVGSKSQGRRIDHLKTFLWPPKPATNYLSQNLLQYTLATIVILIFFYQQSNSINQQIEYKMRVRLNMDDGVG